MPARKLGLVRFLSLFSPQLLELIYLPLAGRDIRSTVQILCLPPSEFLLESIRCLTLMLARRFPNPVPSGTRVPGWALLDVTVRF